MKTVCVFDTETTGLLLPRIAPLDKQPFIIELGASKVRGGKVIEEFSQLVNPGFPISEEITRITGITNEQLADKPTFKAVFPMFKEFMRGSDVLVAHNADFDKTILENDLKRIGMLEEFPMPPEVVCTVQEFSHLAPRRLKLTQLYEMSCGKPLAQTHRALDDVNALLEILTAQKWWEAIS